jgi:hypothetical protein
MTAKHWLFLFLIVPVLCFLGFWAGVGVQAERSKSQTVNGRSHVDPMEFICAGTVCSVLSGGAAAFFLVWWVKGSSHSIGDQ